ncbi:MAG: threonylcarbamoyladenosine tRNA methylthiotransferase MtaB [Gaiellales bacterium]|nr:threonylcarbamoyladenosine tRNA methylthiotransferase MtaB [Gaiellales bacterium]
MTSFATEFLGCKVSMSDAQEIRERLAADGHAERPAVEAAVRVVNTCCVTAEAVAKSRKALRRASRTAERVVATGCAASLPGALEGLPRNITVLPRSSEVVADAVSEAVGPLGCVGGATPGFARTRAYVKIQDGCSFTCSYCVIPQVRGMSRSRTAEAVIRDARRRVAQGHRELVLTGVNLGCFRDRAAGFHLSGLLSAVAQLEGLDRVRLSSIEINHLTDGLLEVMAGESRVAPHLHVPMQSGDAGVLQAMRRRYSAEGFLAKVSRARERVPGMSLTTDVIVGHPAEDEVAFERTLEAVRCAGFTRVHVFPYSPRPGTRDAADDPVPVAEKQRRSAELRALADRQAAAHRMTKLGRRELVLVEGNSGRGYAGDYTPFVVPGAPAGHLVEAIGVDVEPDAVVARLCA